MKFFIVFLVFLFLPLSFANGSTLSTGELNEVNEFTELGIKVETIASNLSIPWSIDFAPDGRIFFSERIGQIHVIEEGKVSPPILDLDVVGGEGGMLGLALDPFFEKNQFIYIYYTYSDFLSTKNKVVRYSESNNTLFEETIILDNIPGSSYHDGGRIKFGPDGKLYITTGDSGNSNLSQEIDSLAGKILRINSDGTIPEDNPFPNSPVYSYGHRNPQGIAWSEAGILVATEHGPTGLRVFGHDEINLINPGQNYGWPDIIGDDFKEGMTSPVLHSGDDTWAPSGATFYYGQKILDWNGMFFVASLRGQHLHMIEFDWSQENVRTHEKLFSGEFGRLRDVVVGPDDSLYLLTSNTDGRGNPSDNDDKILKISSILEVKNFEQCISEGNPVIESDPKQCITSDGKNFFEGINSQPKSPQWIRTLFIWYNQQKITDHDLINAIQFLIKNEHIKFE